MISLSGPTFESARHYVSNAEAQFRKLSRHGRIDFQYTSRYVHGLLKQLEDRIISRHYNRFCLSSPERISVEEMEIVFKVVSTRHISTFEMNYGGFGHVYLESFFKAFKSSTIFRLILRNCGIRNNWKPLADGIIANPNHLRTLDLSGNDLITDGPSRLCEVLKATRLEVLKIASCSLKDSVMILILENLPATLCELDISGNSDFDITRRSVCDVVCEQFPKTKLQILHVGICGYIQDLDTMAKIVNKTLTLRKLQTYTRHPCDEPNAPLTRFICAIGWHPRFETLNNVNTSPQVWYEVRRAFWRLSCNRSRVLTTLLTGKVLFHRSPKCLLVMLPMCMFRLLFEMAWGLSELD